MVPERRCVEDPVWWPLKEKYPGEMTVTTLHQFSSITYVDVKFSTVGSGWCIWRSSRRDVPHAAIECGLRPGDCVFLTTDYDAVSFIAVVAWAKTRQNSKGFSQNTEMLGNPFLLNVGLYAFCGRQLPNLLRCGVIEFWKTSSTVWNDQLLSPKVYPSDTYTTL